MTDLKDQIQQQREQARETCSAEGSTSAECAVAWDTVEELQAEAAHQRQNNPEKNSLETYCDNNPDAPECRVYED